MNALPQAGLPQASLASRLLLATVLVTASLVPVAPAGAEAGGPFRNPALTDCRALAAPQGSAESKGMESSVVWSELAVGEWLIVPNVCPQLRYFPTGLILTPGATYAISAQGHWKDGVLPPTGPEGWPGLLLEAANRIPWRRMASLSASAGRNERHLHTIGRYTRWSTPSRLTQSDDRRLYLFANDWPWPAFYANNRDLEPGSGGPMRVTIHRLF